VVGCQDSMLALTNGTPKAEAVETLSLSRRIEPQGMPDVSGNIFSHRLEAHLQFFCFDAPQILETFRESGSFGGHFGRFQIIIIR